MLNPCFDFLYRALGLRGGGLYPFFVAVTIICTNFYNLKRKPIMGPTRSLRMVIRIESFLFFLFPLTCVLESRLRGERLRACEGELLRIKEIVGSKRKYNKYTIIQQIVLLIYPAMVFVFGEGVMEKVNLLPVYFDYIINYSAVVRYSDAIWTIEDLFKHLNNNLKDILTYQKSHKEHAISRICTLHKLLVDQATELNETLQIQMLVCVLLIIVRCLVYPSIIVMILMGHHESRYKYYVGLGLIAIDLLHVTNVFHPPSRAAEQARKTCKILRSEAKKQQLNHEMHLLNYFSRGEIKCKENFWQGTDKEYIWNKLRFFLKKLTLQELKFSLLDLVEQNDLTIILVMQYITTRLFILMTF